MKRVNAKSQIISLRAARYEQMYREYYKNPNNRISWFNKIDTVKKIKIV